LEIEKKVYECWDAAVSEEVGLSCRFYEMKAHFLRFPFYDVVGRAEIVRFASNLVENCCFFVHVSRRC
jgi:hypothetical protein